MCQRGFSIHALGVFACAVGVFLVHGARGDEPADKALALHHQIDQLVEQAAVGPLARQCSDTDFVRRIYLDLTGAIPSAQQVKEFLADPATNKRERLIDQLIGSPEFNRTMAMQFSVILLERRNEKNVKHQLWEQYLYQSFESDKPLDQLASELIYSEAADGSLHPANKFILSREVEPNAVTRDVGRLVFGMDLQCAQCHNHPLIDAYLQEDYYGLYAFLHRTSLFTIASNKEVRLAEKPDGEASFKSVFTGNSRDHTTPRLPKEFSLFDEPLPAAGLEYLVKPDKNVAGRPAFSRREALAKMIERSDQFTRNMANRIWALMLSRGIVHPLDFHHQLNSPANPALLKLIATQLKANDFRLRPVIRSIALSKTYQRSVEPPAADTINYSDVAARGHVLNAALKEREAQIGPFKEAAAKSDAAYAELLSRQDAHAIELAKHAKLVSEARAKYDKAAEAHQKAEEPKRQLEPKERAVAEASQKLRLAADAVGDDKQLAEAATKVAEKAKQLAQSLEKLTKAAQATANGLEKAQAELTAADAALAKVNTGKVDPTQLQQLEMAQIAAAATLANGLFDADLLRRQVNLCNALNEYHQLETTDTAKASSVWLSIVDQWTVAGQVAPLKPLSPEQLTMSAMQATGALPMQVKEVVKQIEAAAAKAAAAEKAAAEKAAAEKAAGKPAPEKAVADKGGAAPADAATQAPVEKIGKSASQQLKLIDALRSRLDQFATLYGGLPGEDFQATVNQALFFGNGSVIDEWLKPAGDNLSVQLGKASSQAEMADILFLSVLSRPATEEEKLDFAESLAPSEIDRQQVFNQWVWALLSSNEFRFNH
ncbi:MAG: DUF1549 domain-containing protein [Pirellulaceae bacterium]|nr:DUF1549 domain-containing protein [Pirellulaceae bacterium]